MDRQDPLILQPIAENAGAPEPFARNGAVKMASKIELAVVWVEKARKGSRQWFTEMPESQMRTYRLRKKVKGVVHVVMCLYLCLALFEQPSWCLGDDVPCANLFHNMPNAGLPVFPFHLSNTLEICFLVVLSLRTWLRWRSLGGLSPFQKSSQNGSGSQDSPLDVQNSFSERLFTSVKWYWERWSWSSFLLICLCLAFADCIVAIFNIKGIIPGNFRLARLLRPLVFMACYKKLREAVVRVIASIPSYANVLLSLSISVVLFTWVGIIIFARSDEGNDHFASWEEGLASMWVLFTTANNPDVWLEAYHSSRWSFAFFFIYMVFSFYLLNNILLASVFEGYKEKLKGSLQTFFSNRKVAIKTAFDLLADETSNGEKGITLETWISFFDKYCDGRYGGVSLHFSSEDKRSNKQRAEDAFKELDSDHSEGLSLDEFEHIFDFLFFHDTHLYLQNRSTSTARYCLGKRLSRLITHGISIRLGRIAECRISWDSFVDFFILADIAIAFVCTFIFVADHRRNEKFSVSVWRYGGTWFWISLLFSCFYAVETGCKVVILGFGHFWYAKPFMHRYDLFNVIGLAALQMIYAFGPGSDLIIRSYLLLRIARTLRLLNHVRSLRQLASVMTTVAPTFQRLCFMLIIVCYMYATVGEQFFGGLITEDNKDLQGTGFATARYFDLNFNDFFSSMVTLFVLMIVNNWFVVSDGFLHATGTAWSQVFFVSFFVVVNMIVLNVLVSLILECFSPLRKELEEQEQQDQDMQRAARLQAPPEDGSCPVARVRLLRNDRESVLQRVLLDPEGQDSPTTHGGPRDLFPASSTTNEVVPLSLS